jgi:chondroitin AC lyase
MKDNCCSKITFLAILTITFVAAGCNRDIELLRKRFTSDLLEPRVNEKEVQICISTISNDGTWPGIDYIDTSRTAFQHTEHLSNMLAMARAYKKEGSSYKGDKDLKKALFSALDFWLKNDFICENWWNNQIGTPNTMVSLLFILDTELSSEQTDKMLAIAGRANLNASGARPSGDRIKIAGILAKATLFRRDVKMSEEVMKVIEGEIKFASDEQDQISAEGKRTGERILFAGTGRGMQSDYSFHHRADRVNNTLSYGTGYADAFAEWAAIVEDTRYRFSDSSLKLLTDYYLDGICKQMIYSRIPDPGVMNRDISRRGSGGPLSTSTPERILLASDYRRAELEDVIKSRKGEPIKTQSFAKLFWQTEHFVYQRPDFYTSVRMYSTRNMNMEQPYNGEGLTNHYRADGTNYISLTGNEYKDIAPVFDWRKIPGATILESETMPPENQIQKTGLTDFVGGVTDGIYGAVAFDFISPHDLVRAKKAWFFFDDEYLCMGTQIQSDNRENAVATTINQCSLDGDVTINGISGTSVMPSGNRKLEKINWIHHNSIGYFFPNKQSVNLFSQTASGTWFSINRQTTTSKEEIKKDVFKLWLDHGIRPTDGKYEYVVLPASEIKDVQKYAANPAINILSNTSELQAGSHNGLNIVYAVFYRAGMAKVADNLTIEIDSPGMVMIRHENEKISSITVSDPSRKLSILSLTINRKIEKSGDLYKTSWDNKTGTTRIDFKLPQDKYHGKSITLNIE